MEIYKKEDFIEKYGEEAWERRLQLARERNRKHPEKVAANNQRYRGNHPEKVKAFSQESGCKGGKYYDKKLEYKRTGLQRERNIIRNVHANQYRKYKKIIASKSQIHHEWIPRTSNYNGMALVETDQHQHGIIDVIQILEGDITLLTEADILNQGVI